MRKSPKLFFATSFFALGWRRVLTTLTILIPILSLCACEPRPSSKVLREFESGIIYEELADVNDGVRVLSIRKDGENSCEIIVPGMVAWCEPRGSLIVGEKTSEKKPAEWMDDDWEKRSGFFVLDPRKLNPEDPAAKESVDLAIRWFATKKDFEGALAAIEKELHPSLPQSK